MQPSTQAPAYSKESSEKKQQPLRKSTWRQNAGMVKGAGMILLTMMLPAFAARAHIYSADLSDCDERKRKMVSSRFDAHNFIVDSGAATSCCWDASCFKNIRRTATLQFVKTASGELIEVSGIGTIVIRMLDQNGVWNSIEVHNVLYVPELHMNLLSSCCGRCAACSPRAMYPIYFGCMPCSMQYCYITLCHAAQIPTVYLHHR